MEKGLMQTRIRRLACRSIERVNKTTRRVRSINLPLVRAQRERAPPERHKISVVNFIGVSARAHSDAVVRDHSLRPRRYVLSR